MYGLLILLLIPILLIFVFLLFVILFAYSWVRGLLYSLFGKKRGNGYGQSYSQDSRSNTSHTSSPKNGDKKIFSKDDGEYIDFEVVD